VQGDLAIANADLSLNDAQKLILDDDEDTFLTKYTAGELTIANNGRTRVGFLDDAKISLFNTGETISESYARFSDNNLKTIQMEISGQLAIQAIQSDILKGVVYTCNDAGANAMEEDFKGQGQNPAVYFDVHCGDAVTPHYGLIAQAISGNGADNVVNRPSGLPVGLNNVDIASQQIILSGTIWTVDYDQAVPLLVEAVDYLSTQIGTDAFVNESGDQMQGDLRLGFGSDVLWYSDNDVTLTASVDALTGNASFAGDVSVTDILGTVTLGGGLVQATTTDNNIVIGSGAIAITDPDGTLSLRDGSIIMDGDIAMVPLKTVDGVDVSELNLSVANLDSVYATDNDIANLDGTYATDNDVTVLGDRVTVLEAATTDYVQKSGDTMTGDLNFDDAYCLFMTGHNCTVDNVDVSDLYDTVQAIGTNLTDDFVNVGGDFMTNDLRLRTGSAVRFFADAAESSLTASIDGATGDGFLGGTLTITPNKKFYLDGGPDAANGGDTFVS
jgi:hypothetical protein